jgi:uncharacterized protein YndB with AHSA1/START domain
MNIDNFKPAIVYTIYIASTPEKVWQALTTAEFSKKYFSGFAVEAELKVGGAFVARAPDGSVHISGEVIECDPPRRLTITWNVNWPSSPAAVRAGPRSSPASRACWRPDKRLSSRCSRRSGCWRR